MKTKPYASPAIEHQEKIADIPFVENRAVGETAQTLRDELLYRRATQTYLWALPLLNTLGMQRGSERVVVRGWFGLVRVRWFGDGPSQLLKNKSKF